MTKLGDDDASFEQLVVGTDATASENGETGEAAARWEGSEQAGCHDDDDADVRREGVVHFFESM